MSHQTLHLHLNLRFVNPNFLALVRSQLIAKWADSFMTSPSWPVRVSCPSPSIRLASTNMISPPRGVQARPTATPGRVSRSDTFHTVKKLWMNKRGRRRRRRSNSGPCRWSPTNLHVKECRSQDVFQGRLVNDNGHLRECSFVWFTASHVSDSKDGLVRQDRTN